MFPFAAESLGQLKTNIKCTSPTDLYMKEHSKCSYSKVQKIIIMFL